MPLFLNIIRLFLYLERKISGKRNVWIYKWKNLAKIMAKMVSVVYVNRILNESKDMRAVARGFPGK